MGQFPSFWQLQPSEGIQPVPLQTRVLNFTPLLNSLKSLPSTTTSGKKTEDEDIKFRDMRLGYTRQLFAKGDAIKEKMRAMESIYGTMVFDMPAYQQMERDYSDNFSFQNQLYGALEKEKIDRFDANTKDVGSAYHLEALKRGEGLRTMSEWSDIMHNTESTTLDPTSRNARWTESFIFNPKVYNLQDAENFLKAHFEEPHTTYSENAYHSIFVDMIGDMVGAREKSGSDATNHRQLSDAEADALRLMGLGTKVIEKDGKQYIVNQDFYGGGDVTNPLVGGLMQSWLQSGYKKGDGIYIGDKKIADYGDKGGLTDDGTKLFAEFAFKHINSHMTKRMGEKQARGGSFYEQSPNAYGSGALADAFSNIDQGTEYYPDEIVLDDQANTFQQIFGAMLTPEMKASLQKSGAINPDGSFNPIVQQQMDDWQAVFDANYATPQMIGDVMVPAPYTKVVSQDGKSTYYKPNYEFDTRRNENLENMRNSLSQRLEDARRSGNKSAEERVEREIQMFNTMANGGFDRVRNAPQTTISEGAIHSAYQTKGGWTKPIDESLIASIMPDGKIRDASDFTMRAASFGNGWIDMQGLQGFNIVGTKDGTMTVMGPGKTNFGVIKPNEANIAKIQASNPNAQIDVSDGVLYVNGKAAMGYVNTKGDIENPSFRGSADNGWMLPNQTDTEIKYTHNAAEGLAAAGSPQAGAVSPSKVVKGITVSFQSLDNLRAIRGNAPVELAFPKDKALQAAQTAKGAITTTNDVDNAFGYTTGSGVDIMKGKHGVTGTTKEKKQYITVDESKLSAAGVTASDVRKRLNSMGVGENATEQQLELAIGEAILIKRGEIAGKTIKVYVPTSPVKKISGNTISDVVPYFVQTNKINPVTKKMQESGVVPKTDFFTMDMEMDVTDHWMNMVTETKNQAERNEGYNKTWNNLRGVNVGQEDKKAPYSSNRPVPGGFSGFRSGGEAKDKRSYDDIMSQFSFAKY